MSIPKWTVYQANCAGNVRTLLRTDDPIEAWVLMRNEQQRMGRYAWTEAFLTDDPEQGDQSNEIEELVWEVENAAHEEALAEVGNV